MAMLRLSPEKYHRAKRVVRRLDHATGEINPFLFAVAIGLFVLYISCLVGLVIRLPIVHSNACVTTSGAPAAGEVRGSGSFAPDTSFATG
jgi:hypothetical protein